MLYRGGVLFSSRYLIFAMGLSVKFAVFAFSPLQKEGCYIMPSRPTALKKSPSGASVFE